MSQQFLDSSIFTKFCYPTMLVVNNVNFKICSRGFWKFFVADFCEKYFFFSDKTKLITINKKRESLSMFEQRTFKRLFGGDRRENNRLEVTFLEFSFDKMSFVDTRCDRKEWLNLDRHLWNKLHHSWSIVVRLIGLLLYVNATHENVLFLYFRFRHF